MIDALSGAHTALDAQSVGTRSTADGTVNASASNSAPKQVTLLPMNPGVAVGPIIASAQASVDVGSELINLMAAQQAYEAAKATSAPDPLAAQLLATI